jgi:hypothetical protein
MRIKEVTQWLAEQKLESVLLGAFRARAPR